jgi:hypothetical protein
MWTDFFGRKTPPAPLAIVAPQSAAEPRDDLAELHLEIAMQQVQLASLEEEARATGSQLAEVALLASQLKVQISEGISSASVELDSLEREQRTIERSHEGLKLRIVSLQAAIAPKLRKASDLAVIRDQQRQEAAITELREQVERMTDSVLDHWRAGCVQAFDLVSLLDAAMGGRSVPLDEEHRRQVLQVNLQMGAKVLKAQTELVNVRMAFARMESFHRLTILPAKPKDLIARTG